MIFQARYYDGIKAEPHDIQLNLGAETLLIDIPMLNNHMEWEYKDLRIIEKPEYNRPLILSHLIETNVRIVVADNSLYNYLIKKIPKKNVPLISISTSSKSLALWSIPAIAIIFAIYWLAPQVIEPIVKNFPATWEKKLGDYTVNALVGDKPVCNHTEGIKALNKLVDVLAQSSENQPLITASVIKDDDINAFTAPGGKIVIFSKLIVMAESQDELAGVVAHEIGHVVKRHTTEAMVRGLGLGLVVNILFGGSTASTSANLANEFFQLQYSRNFERQADEVAMQTLYNAAIDNGGLIKFFIRADAKEKGVDGKILSYISTHPANADRIKAFQDAKNTSKARQILTKNEWQELKNICQ